MPKSKEFFVNHVWPNTKHLVGGGDLKSAEETNLEDPKFMQELDYFAGIDGWQILRDKQTIRSVASRTQPGKIWRTLTIRYQVSSGYPTEFQKRTKACVTEADQGYLYPHWTMQAYYDETTRECEVAVVETKILYRFLHSLNFDFGSVGFYFKMVTTKSENTQMLVLPWSLLEQHIKVQYAKFKY